MIIGIKSPRSSHTPCASPVIRYPQKSPTVNLQFSWPRQHQSHPCHQWQSNDNPCHSFWVAGKTKTPQAVAKENKQAKDAKKDAKDNTKANKEAFNNIAKTTNDASNRMEMQINKLTENITQSNKELQSSLLTLTGALQQLITNQQPHLPTLQNNTPHEQTEEPPAQEEDESPDNIPQESTQSTWKLSPSQQNPITEHTIYWDSPTQ